MGSNRLTFTITEGPTILSGTLRSTLDVFDEYEDKDIPDQPPPPYSAMNWTEDLADW